MLISLELIDMMWLMCIIDFNENKYKIRKSQYITENITFKIQSITSAAKIIYICSNINKINQIFQLIDEICTEINRKLPLAPGFSKSKFTTLNVVLVVVLTWTFA